MAHPLFKKVLTVECFLFCIVPADGVKGKTWGPSTCHQRERGTLPSLGSPMAHYPAGRGATWSKSAPNLDKSLGIRSGSSISGSPVLLSQQPHAITPGCTATPHDIGNTNTNSNTYQEYLLKTVNLTTNTNYNNTTCKSCLELDKHEQSTDCLTYSNKKISFPEEVCKNLSRKFSLFDFKTLKLSGKHHHHNNKDIIIDENHHQRSSMIRFSHSIGDITDTKNYDTIYSAKKFVIAKGKCMDYDSTRSTHTCCEHFNNQQDTDTQSHSDSIEDDTQKLLD